MNCQRKIPGKRFLENRLLANLIPLLPRTFEFFNCGSFSIFVKSFTVNITNNFPANDTLFMNWYCLLIHYVGVVY
jgi:hypothetical protein